MSGRKIEEDEVRELVKHGEIGPLDGFVSAKTGNRFPSKIKIVDDEKNPGQRKAELDFGNKVDVNALVPFWTDPKTGAELCEAPTNYVLRERDGDGWKETFKVGRLMCQKEISREQAIQLVTSGKTDLIEKFTSKKGRPFDAFLVRQGAKISWEFPPRKPREGTAKNGKSAPRKAKPPLDLAKAVKLGESKVASRRSLSNRRGFCRGETAGGRIAARCFRIETTSLRQRNFSRRRGAFGGAG